MGERCSSMSIASNMQWSQWSDLPPELLSTIAELLDLIELLSFRGVCKAWKSASSTASDKIESTRDPWFLLHGEEQEGNDSGDCQLVTESGDKYTVSLPELNGTTCIASNQGWLLVFKKQGVGRGSLFFFHPFSKTKIDLPEPPVAELSDHAAAFSCPPTSQDCTVCVINRENEGTLKLNVLRRGKNIWSRYSVANPTSAGIKTINCAAYTAHKQEFYFFDKENCLLSVSTNHEFPTGRFLTCVSAADTTLKSNSFVKLKSYFGRADMKKKLGLAAEEDVSFDTCGTQTQIDGQDHFIYNESIPCDDRVEESKRRRFKGVWIYPKF